MSVGNMNPGVIFVRCLDSTDMTPVEGASAILTWVQADDSFGGRLPLFDTEGKSTTAPSADTTGSGVAVLKFLWDPTHIGYFVSTEPAVRVSATGPALRYGGVFSSTLQNRPYFTTRVGNEHIYQCVNFGQAWSGGKGAFTFSSSGSNSMDALTKIKDIIEWSWKWQDAWIKARNSGKLAPFLPAMKFFDMRPSTEMLALVGGFDVMMERQA